MQFTLKTDGITSRCGRRGCKVVELPSDALPNPIRGNNERGVIHFYRLFNRRTPDWKVVRWDIDEPADLFSKAVG